MKKMIILIVALLGILVVPVLAQEVEPPADWLEVIEGFSGWFGSLAGIAAVTVFIAGFLNGLFKITAKVGRQLVAWLVAIVLSVIGNLVNLGFLAEATWLMTVIYGFGAGLVANGLFDIALVKALILAVESQLNRNK